MLKKTFYKTIEGYHFYSVTVREYKFAKTAGCTYIGQHAIYHGPFKAVVDEEGHLFPREVAVEVCTDTAAKLSSMPYRLSFTVTQAGPSVGDCSSDPAICLPSPADRTNGSACGPGCC